MDKRYIAAGILMTVGLFIVACAVGGMDYGDLTIGQAAVRSVVGLLLMAAAMPVSGDISNERKNR